MTAVWVSIAAVAVINAAIKAAGPVLVGGRALPRRVRGVIALLAPALLTALIVVDTFDDDGRLVLDARALGVGATAVAIALRAPMLLAIALAPVVTALARALA